MTTNAKLAIVLPISGKVNLLWVQIKALAPQLSKNSFIELVLSVNEGALLEQADFQRILQYLQSTKVNFKLVDASKKKGSSYARNQGWANTEAPKILFCDSDDLVSGTWVNEMNIALEKHDLVGGALEYAELNSYKLASWNSASSSALGEKFQFLPFTPGSNLAVSREVLVRASGFDEDLLRAQDIDFCWRAQQLGYKLIYWDKAVVHYRLRDSTSEIMRQAFYYGLGDAKLLKKHKQFGAKVSLGDSIQLFGSPLLNFCLMLLGKAPLSKVVYKFGLLAGRLVGSFRERVRAL